MSDNELELFYRRVFLPLVRRATWKHRLPKEDACDVVQDAFVLALSKLDGSKNPSAWLIQVVDHLALNHRRKAVRRAALSQRWQPPNRVSNDRQESYATDD
jgi:DNA-directed RNA polymerase specialized sigma24 family protein